LELRKVLSTNIKTLRRKSEVSQEELAEITGLSSQTINSIECCRTWVSDTTLLKIAASFNVEVGDLLCTPKNAKNQSALLVERLTNLKENILSDVEERFKLFRDENVVG
jgi:transcriptional regulator with XRE-family HTH domain